MLDYLHGKLGTRESHWVERHLLDCDLCQDAMEGLEKSAFRKEPVAEDISALRKRLDERVKNDRRKIFAYSRLAAAASILLLIGLGLYWYFRNELSTIPATRIAEQHEVKKEQHEIKNEERPITEEQETQPEVTAAASELSEEKKKAVPANAPPPVMQEKIIDIERKDAIVSETMGTAPLPPAPAEDEKTEAMAGSDQVPSAVPEAPEQDFAAEQEHVESRKSLDKEDLSAVEVSGKSRARRHKASVATGARDAVPEEAAFLPAAPKGGMEAYEKYLKNKLEYPEEAKEKNISGEVTVSFLIDRKGKLEDFKIEKGLEESCNEEAIRLIKEGPEWEPAMENGKEVEQRREVTVEFSLRRLPAVPAY